MAETKTTDRKTVVVVVRYEQENTDEILDIWRATTIGNQGVTDVRAFFTAAGHEPDPIHAGDPHEEGLRAHGKAAYDEWNRTSGQSFPGFYELPERTQALWADAVAGVIL